MDHNWTGADGRRAISILLAIAAGMAGLFGVLYGTALVASAVSPDWSVIAGFIAFFILLGIAGAIVSSILRWGREGSYKILFPGYAGRKLPAFVLLDGPDAWKGFQSDGTMMWLGEAGDYFFALRTRIPKKGREVSGEKLLHVGREPLKIAKSDIESVEVFDRSDEDIAESAADRRDYIDRLASALAQKATGIGVRTRIVPYAAYVVVRTSTMQLIFGVPTEIHPQIFDTLTGDVTEQRLTEDPLVESGIDAAKEQATTAATAEIASTEVGSVVTSSVGEAMDLVSTAKWWLNPDAADIATARAERGRLAAHLLAEALRSHQRGPTMAAA